MGTGGPVDLHGMGVPTRAVAGTRTTGEAPRGWRWCWTGRGVPSKVPALCPQCEESTVLGNRSWVLWLHPEPTPARHSVRPSPVSPPDGAPPFPAI